MMSTSLGIVSVNLVQMHARYCLVWSFRNDYISTDNMERSVYFATDKSNQGIDSYPKVLLDLRY